MSRCDLSVSFIEPLSFRKSACKARSLYPLYPSYVRGTGLRTSDPEILNSRPFLWDEALTSFSSTSAEHSTSGRRAHSCSETVGVFPFSVAGLKCPFHTLSPNLACKNLQWCEIDYFTCFVLNPGKLLLYSCAAWYFGCLGHERRKINTFLCSLFGKA